MTSPENIANDVRVQRQACQFDSGAMICVSFRLTLLILGLCLTPCAGVTYYCPNAYDYSRHDPYADGIRISSVTSLTFQVKGRNDAHVLLQNDRNNYRTNVIEIVIGGWGNSQSVIRNSQQGTNRVRYSGSVLSSSTYRWFWISWGSGCIQVGKGNSVGSSRIMNWCSYFPSMHGVRFSFGFGSDGYFVFTNPVPPCPTPGSISYGSRSYTGTTDGSRVTYSCNAGYTFTSGSASRTCSNGAWSGSQPTCGDIDECASSPCKNGAPCTNGQNRFTCACTAGWTGADCNTDVNECASNPCKNGATCHNGRNQYSCTCAGGWQGYNCDQDINECLSEPCQNGATCNNLQNSYTCTCTGGWQGTNCDIDIDECASNPCQNGATCLNNQNNYECECVPGWQGVNCDTDIDECASNPCHNGAACNNLLNEYTCDCTPGWQGYDCDQGILTNVSVARASMERVSNLQNAYRCTCFPQYTARNCDYLIGSPMDGQWGQVGGMAGLFSYVVAQEDSAVPVDGNWGAWSVAAPCQCYMRGTGKFGQNKETVTKTLLQVNGGR
ncbi:fibropellin-1-like, partial [Ruditapes philippinarum]|uniref:fibropellin-1-like n=1 Tax=Ruditapes philippinarum TaxID=129788 RepID=UPI00295AF087